MITVAGVMRTLFIHSIWWYNGSSNNYPYIIRSIGQTGSMPKPATSRQSFLDSSKARFSLLLKHKQKSETPLPDASAMSVQQRRLLPLAVIIALILGFLLIKDFIIVIFLSFIAAVIFYPLYQWLTRKTGRAGFAAALTFVITLFVVIIPLVITVLITVTEIERLIHDLTVDYGTAAMNTSETLIVQLNDFLFNITNGRLQVTPEKLQETLTSFAATIANYMLDLIKNSFSGIASFVTQFILYIFLFTAILRNADTLIRILRTMNPLGDKTSEVYLQRAGQMTKGAVGGQFVIAFCQGIAEAAVLYIAGIDYFFFFALVLSFLSIIPLGGGILAIPIGILQVLTGNIWQGLFILAMHFLVITNIDNVLRPRLIPKSVRLNSALMMLAVFGGIGLFGFLGIVIGPVIMIVVLTTIQIYLPIAERRT